MPGRRSWSRLHRRAQPLSPNEAAQRGGWLVLAPHPDDETLGAGGLIASLAASGGAVTTVFLTDGAGSHIGASGWTAKRVAGLRARELGAAMRYLGLRDPAISLGWSDGSPHAEGTPQFELAVRRLVALCRARGIRQLVTTWEREPHCDHTAAARLLRAAARRWRVAPKFYLVWGWTLPDVDSLLRPMRVTAIPVSRHRGRQRRALACHRSQLGGRIAGAAERFVLARPMRRLTELTHCLLVENRNAT
ncbi:LmbE family N-acetylglucosaminyl deacetylase [Novosphingobium sp. PhB165]|uniref:PIG-L deacetylase family protein n=1 Tax=Novosphingobium sp. PhB165 TaxID=2485105 RepID=UPI0010459498|nr:PIG-L family deacetylase [Novosphingobium sp. PhB165]TCM14413.1 LmbE family N-acetylglucosaminyl deacetylase [Novosphingobium sp. PhB165]